MKMRGQAVAVTLGLAFSLTPLAGWGQASEWNYLTGGNLRGVKAIGNHAWAVGDRGLILHTSDGGNTWEIQVSNTAQNLNGVTFSSDRHGWAVGEGVILKTTNGGATWINLPLPRPWVYYRAASVDSMHCVMTAWTDSVVRTTDGGNTFSIHNVSPDSILTQYIGISFTDSLRGWTVADISIWFVSHTSDGGLTWTTRMDNRYIGATDIIMADSLEGWAAGLNGQIYHTTDGWSTLTVQPSGTGANLKAITFTDNRNGVTVGGTGIFITTNGGQNWQLKVIGTSNFLLGASQGDSTHPIVDGLTGILARSTDQGMNWTKLRSLEAQGQTMFNLALADTQSGYAVGPYGIVVKTTNGGTIWQRQNLGGTSLWFYGVDSPDPNYAWGCGDGGSIYATKNGGTSWASQNSGVSWYLNSVDMVDTLFGVAVGGGDGRVGSRQKAEGRKQQPENDTLRPWESPPVLDKWWWQRELDPPHPTLSRQGRGAFEAQYRVITRTLDGTNWQGVTSGDTPLNGVSFANKRLGWAVGVSGTVIHTSDSGATWQAQTSNVTNTLYWVIFPTLLNGWAVGTGGTIIATTDGGNIWNRQTSNTTLSLYSAAFVNSQRGWVVGDSGVALQTTNGGQTWSFDTTRTKIPLFATRFTDQDHGWSIGGFGLTLGYGRAGQWGVEEQGSKGAGELRVNNGIKAWPNPFVSYGRVPGHEKERFALYDVSGRRVGTYTGERIGADIGSGVYFLMAEGKEGRPTRIVKVR